MEEKTNKSHVLVLPFPVQGHINPMVQFSKRLTAKGSVKVTLITIDSVTKSMPILESGSIKIHSIPHDDETPPQSYDLFLEWFHVLVSKNLTKIVEELSDSEYPVKSDLYPSLRKLVFSRNINFKKADWLLFNSFDVLEKEVIDWLRTQCRIKTIGPIIPSMYLDKRLKDDKEYGLSLFKPNSETCMKWLDSREIGSVVYVSFGSLANLGEQQMEELASGLMMSDFYYLWVVRATEENKLTEEFMSKSKEKCLIVNWCPQLNVLSHQAVGCFFTHCGWNSTLEALSLGVPMVAMPQWSDQPTNAKFISDVWQTGVRVKARENGVVNRDEIASSIREVMREEKGIMLKENANKWKKLAKEAVDEGGSSDKNIEEFLKLVIN
ncbi:hypothetical protein KY284_009733 [Solanum tuberosum]|nr:hypothetical protein KY284_009733 [Solanum tuberosum]